MRGLKAKALRLSLLQKQRLKFKRMGIKYASSLRSRIVNQRGQGTTEYAILVGVLVVIAILAITIFKPKIQELWNAITTGIQGL